MYRVSGGIGFWAAVDALEEADDPRVEDLRRIFWALVEDGPELPAARPTRIALGNNWQNGYRIDLPDGTGFLTYITIPDPDDGTPFIAIYQLTWIP
jgi:hypothetical protein